jgi:hypothetical protein
LVRAGSSEVKTEDADHPTVLDPIDMVSVACQEEVARKLNLLLGALESMVWVAIFMMLISAAMTVRYLSLARGSNSRLPY